MKFSSWAAIGHLLGGKLAGQKEYDWVDKVALGVFVKNELLEKDGGIRKLLEGRSDEEIKQIKTSIDEYVEEQNDDDDYKITSDMSNWEIFKRGMKRGEKFKFFK